ncbi:hypothetical protein K490DRAFT_62394 [Saccharata proteae CBS 121410]|uniref:DUF4048 domain-containing protein n=1 Tax=Saccharata proteae CBS 121410 TaxID=1314787 RepID=A0A9P4I1J9_9PEZI|nr:hypothetical protein K490DRAFT_62394 [Saccharata proteae CBS 121410]
MSHADASHRSKRISLNFPIQPAAASNTSPRSSRPASWVGSPACSPDILQPSPLLPTDGNGNFFVALAAQERKVLELKEELSKAEERLKDLKKQWATHESFKKHRGSRGFHQMQPINTNFANIGAMDDDSSFSLQREMERRKALLNGVRQSNRKVFSGSRHTRTLSLLSPDNSTHSPSFPALTGTPSEDPVRFQNRARSTTTPQLVPNDISKHVGDDAALSSLQREDLLRTGKQMANDFKDGLWTFIEDLRQATVGDEGVNGTQTRTASGQPLRRLPSKAELQAAGLARSKSLSAAKKPMTPHPSGDGSSLIDIESSFWREHGIEEPKPAVTTKVVKAPRSGKTPEKIRTKASQEFEESWDMWETTPNDSDQYTSGHNSTNTSISISDGRTSPFSERSTPRTSTSSARVALDSPGHSKRDSVPWPNLVKLSPSNLKHSVSHLMDEWEKSISPPAEAAEAPAEAAEASALEDYISHTGAPSKTSKAD